MGRHDWLICEGQQSTWKTELAVLGEQINRWPATRELERTFPQVQLATGSEIIMIQLGLRYIAAKEAIAQVQAVQARELTYAQW